MKTLAIIGTAGRKDDAAKLEIKHWNAMCKAAQRVIEMESITHLVSGGAAWADHVAVKMHQHLSLPLKIWMPEKAEDIKTTVYYHAAFSKVIGRNTYNEMRDGNDISLFGSFKDRNTKVADAADLFLAITFGHGREVKDGGTLDTVTKMKERGVRGYHLDLNFLKLYLAK